LFIAAKYKNGFGYAIPWFMAAKYKNGFGYAIPKLMVEDAHRLMAIGHSVVEKGVLASHIKFHDYGRYT
jgi:hypothetical protein